MGTVCLRGECYKGIVAGGRSEERKGGKMVVLARIWGGGRAEFASSCGASNGRRKRGGGMVAGTDTLTKPGGNSRGWHNPQ